MGPVTVRLSLGEMRLAAAVAIGRRLAAISNGRSDAHGFCGDPWEIDINGAMGEMAVARALNRYWTGAGQTLGEDTDVGGLQVRTRSKHWHELYIWPQDPDNAPFVLVTGTPPEFVVRGWIWAREAKREEWFGQKTAQDPAYWVPQSALHPLEP